MLPNLIIIGAQKCGTTSLHYYLDRHPQISMSKEKELNFFTTEFNWSKGVRWYESNFTGNAKVHGEASPSYTNYPFYAGVPERMHSVVPEAKLIYVLRDPIDRILSHYVHVYAVGREGRNLTDALKDFEHNKYILRTKYWMQLEQYLEYFPKSRILVITQEDLLARRRETMREVFQFLEVESSFYSLRFFKKMHQSRYKRRKNEVGLRLARTLEPKLIQRLHPRVRGVAEKVIYFPFSSKLEPPNLDPQLRQDLIDYLRDDLNRLRAFTGRRFEQWCV
jgi:hypothetical protein